MKFKLDVADVFLVVMIMVVLGFGMYGLFRFLNSIEVEQSDYKQISIEMHKAKLSKDTAVINAILEVAEDKVITVGEYGHIKQVIYQNHLEKKSDKAKLLEQVEKEKAR